MAYDAVATEWTRVELPYGWWRGGEVTRAVSIRPIEGSDELALEASLARHDPPLASASILIDRCALAEGEAVNSAELVIGDREILLRALYAQTVAPAFEALVTCGCGEAMYFEVDLRSLAAEVPEAGPAHELDVGGTSVKIRVPVAADVAAAMRSNAPEAALARACTGVEAAADSLSEALGRLDPNAECAIELECAGCGARTTAYLDGFDILRRALSEGGDVISQVDRLARVYGWSEADILKLPRRRRQRYLALAAE